MSSYRYLQHSEDGSTLDWRAGECPQPGAGQLRIKVQASGINRPDLLQRYGLYPPPADASPVLGLEAAGVVDAVGEGVSESLLGQAVCALTAGGAYATHVLVNQGHVLPVPDGFTMQQAAALPETLFTVWHNLFQRAALQNGESVLVHGGTSGIGTTAIQLLKSRGHTVFTTAGSDEKCQQCLELGADVAINYNDEAFDERVLSATDQRGVNCILDLGAGDHVAKNIRCAADEGRMVYIAFLRGAEASINIAEIMMRRLTITGSTLRAQSVDAKTAIAAELSEQVWPGLSRGDWSPKIHQVFAWSDVADAHDTMASGAHCGKLVLSMDGLSDFQP